MVQKQENDKIKIPGYFNKILLHEIFMTGLFVQLLIRLVICGTLWTWVLIYTAVLMIYIGFIHQGIITMSPLINRLRLITNMIIMNIAFTSIKYVIPALGKTPQDNRLMMIDQFIVGSDLSLWVQRFYSKPLTEIMSIGYMLFILFLFLTFILYSFRADLNKLSRFCLGLFILYGIGISGYSVVPAQGPYIFLADGYSRPLEGYLFTELNRLMVAFGSSAYDVFPSLHVGVGLFLLMFYRRYDRPFFSCYLLPFVLLVMSTIYLRYHYVIDLVCGVMLSLACFHLGDYVFKKISDESRDHSISKT